MPRNRFLALFLALAVAFGVVGPIVTKGNADRSGAVAEASHRHRYHKRVSVPRKGRWSRPAPTTTTAPPAPAPTTAPPPTTAAPAPVPTTAAPATTAPPPTTAAPTPTAPAPATGGSTLFAEAFERGDGVVTNEYAYWNPNASNAARSSAWEMTSGSLFAAGRAGYSGKPDDKAPNATSSTGNNSAIFRLNTARSDFGDVDVSFRLRNMGLTSTSRTPSTEWDGVHVWLRYQSEEHLYYVSVNRRDNKITVKKKVPGGPSNGGTYTALAWGSLPVKYGEWTDFRTSVRNNADGSVSFRLWADGRLVLEAKDQGAGGVPPIRQAGAVGVRGDNAEFYFDDFRVTPAS